MLHLCGCYYLIDSTDYYVKYQKNYLPLLDSSAHTTILSTTSRTVLRQTFTNPSTTDPIKACNYTFPLYDGVSVVGFTCRVGKRVLTGLVKEKFKAKQIFDAAVAKGETAGLLTQAPEASDVFSTKLGNIPAGESVIVEVTYIGELKHTETEGIRFTIPTSIAPRYGSGPAVSSNFQPKADQGIKITVDINMPEGSFIKGVQSPSHPIAVSMGVISTSVNADPTMSKASATLSLGTAALEKDFVLIVSAKDVGIPKALLETHPTIPNHRALMATLVPKFSLPPSRPEIVFVADRSGSMSGTSIQLLIAAMHVLLKSIPVGVKFNICSFGSSHSFLWTKSQPYSQETLAQATTHVNGFTADMGGTETHRAVKATIDRRFSDLPLEVMLLTDGDIWQQDTFFQYLNEQVQQSKGNIRVFPLGIGNGVSHALIEGMARAGNGFASAVQSGERLDNSVVRMLRGALSPHITDYTLEVKYEKQDDFEVVEKVAEGMHVLISDDKGPEPPKATISLFDANVNPAKDNIKTTGSPYDHLPIIPYPCLHQAPHIIPSLYAFSRTSVYLLMSPETIQRNPTAVVLRATSTHGPLSLEIPIETLSEPGTTIHQLAAKKAVQDLEEGRGWIYDAKDQTGKLVKERYPSCFQELVEKEAVRLGEKLQIAGKWTSFVAVAANDKEIALEKEKRQDSSKYSFESDEDQDEHEDDFAEAAARYVQRENALKSEIPCKRMVSTASRERKEKRRISKSNHCATRSREPPDGEMKGARFASHSREDAEFCSPVSSITAQGEEVTVRDGLAAAPQKISHEVENAMSSPSSLVTNRRRLSRRHNLAVEFDNPSYEQAESTGSVFKPLSPGSSPVSLCYNHALRTAEYNFDEMDFERSSGTDLNSFVDTEAPPAYGVKYRSKKRDLASPPPPPKPMPGASANFSTGIGAQVLSTQETIQNALTRGERIDDLAKSSKELSKSASTFARLSGRSSIGGNSGTGGRGAFDNASSAGTRGGGGMGGFGSPRSSQPGAPGSVNNSFLLSSQPTGAAPSIGTNTNSGYFGGFTATESVGTAPTPLGGTLLPQSTGKSMYAPGPAPAPRQRSQAVPELRELGSRVLQSAGFRRKKEATSYEESYDPTIGDDGSETDIVFKLINLQSFAGYWPHLPGSQNLVRAKGIGGILGFEIPSPPNASISHEAWITMLVVKFLEDKIPEEEGRWGLVVEKARAWLAGLQWGGANGDLATLEAEASKVVEKQRLN